MTDALNVTVNQRVVARLRRAALRTAREAIAQRVLEHVEEKTSFSLAEIQEPDQRAAVVAARFATVRLLHATGMFSAGHIAQIVKREKPTVLYALGRLPRKPLDMKEQAA